MASLIDEINEYKASSSKKASPEKKRINAQAIKKLEESGIAKGLKKGDHAPDFTLPDATGRNISLSDQLAKGPVILSFYRGGWCPYCNLELRAYQRALPEIKNAGAQLIAISPQTPDASLSTKEKDELEFFVLSDEGGEVAKAYDLLFKLQDELIELYKKSGIDLPAHNGNENWELPKPATFVVDQRGTIVFSHVDSDYKNRTDPEEVIGIVKALR
ncbi:peroxiredoxin-like family protein [Sporolactobacillus putidus]|uniref:thioredoxin-dependent peroxiredoxin n=1 Tax=Sporolactobacillus putidus TaxID=492735 RepID=A0A917W2P6_9BACL|nr:peroxiredoxin-like family protein [Sporolactobacillus putidus]GGL54937.1 alkyl hydroperoxide reductase [Sporolactobacillus putidus]